VLTAQLYHLRDAPTRTSPTEACANPLLLRAPSELRASDLFTTISKVGKAITGRVDVKFEVYLTDLSGKGLGTKGLKSCLLKRDQTVDVEVGKHAVAVRWHADLLERV
jgi:hypothetical protein